VFYARYTVKGGKRGMMQLGNFPKLKLEAARELARKTITAAHAGNVDGRNIVRCEECGERLFFRAHGRKFCSSRCKNQKAMRQWLIAHATKDSDGEHLTRLGKKRREGILVSGESLLREQPGRESRKK